MPDSGLPFDLTVSWQGKSRGEPSPPAGWQYGLAVALARRMRQRVAGQAKPEGGTFSAYSARKGRVFLSPRYPHGPNAKIHETGAVSYASSEEFHRDVGAKPGSFYVSGGMWAGLTVLVTGQWRSRILFRGRSEGQRMTKRGNKRSGLKISNAQKAGTVLAQTKIHILEPANDEIGALISVAEEMIRREVGHEIPGVVWSHTATAGGLSHKTAAMMLAAVLRGDLRL